MASDDDDERHKLEHVVESTETTDTRDVYLRDGRTLKISESSGNELVEIRGSSGQVEVRIVLTDKGPILQMDSVRLELRADEAVEIASKRVEIKASEEIEVTAEGDVRVKGKIIWLN